MLTAAQALENARLRLKPVIDYERRVCGSLMTAYKRVASRIGTSASKVRRILRRADDFHLHAHEDRNIETLFAAVPPQETWPERRPGRKVLRLARSVALRICNPAKRAVPIT